MTLCPTCNERPAQKQGRCLRCYMKDYRARKAGVPVGVPVEDSTQPPPTPAPSDRAEIAALISTAISSAMASVQADPTDGLLDELGALREEIETLKSQGPQVTELHVTSDRGTYNVEGLHHSILPQVIQILACGINVALVGPAGSGKTYLAKQAAEALGRPFFLSGAILQKYELTGYQNAQGEYISSSFRKAFEFGGVFLWDEIDASAPEALVAFNSALENGHADFPDGTIARHPDFVCIAAANTYGRGADRVYVGRTQLDGATLDRFAFIEMGYDLDLERAIAGNDAWVTKVTGWRNRAEDLKIRHIISPRASIKGAALLRAGVDETIVENALVWKGLDAAQIAKIKGE